ncbi:MAG: hypothetical protein K2N78_11765 [Oscillospiraceae bacterium]|nr:hypothetical protein [Oscillospiraceae bacterium]
MMVRKNAVVMDKLRPLSFVGSVSAEGAEIMRGICGFIHVAEFIRQKKVPVDVIEIGATDFSYQTNVDLLERIVPRFVQQAGSRTVCPGACILSIVRNSREDSAFFIDYNTYRREVLLCTSGILPCRK